MSIIDRQVEATYAPSESEPALEEPGTTAGTQPHRAPRRPPASIDRLCDRIRALERGEPMIEGELRTAVLAELALVQLEAERLSLDTWRSDAHQQRSSAQIEALAEQVDRLSVHWPREAEPAEHDPTEPEIGQREEVRP